MIFEISKFKLAKISSKLLDTKKKNVFVKLCNKEYIRNLSKENIYLMKILKKMDGVPERQKQYYRRNCLLIYGVDKKESDDTIELSIKVTEEHLNQKNRT